MKHLILYILCSFFLINCDNKSINKSQIEYNRNSKTVYYNGKPYTGIVLGEDEESFWSAEIVNGKIVLETEKYPNGYKVIKHADGKYEFFNKKNKLITREEFYNTFQ